MSIEFRMDGCPDASISYRQRVMRDINTLLTKYFREVNREYPVNWYLTIDIYSQKEDGTIPPIGID